MPALQAFTKILYIGMVPCGEKRQPLFCKVGTTEHQGQAPYLSFTGVIGPMPSGNAHGGCGQIDMEFAHRDPKDDDKRCRRNELITPALIEFSKGWTAALWLDFLDMWKRWHLNDMHAGCEHQRALGWEREGYDAHPSEPCPTCGYKFGTAWLSESVPDAIIAALKALPDASRKPNWI